MKCCYCDKQHDRRKFCSNVCKNEWHKYQKRIKNKQRKKDNKIKCDHCEGTFFAKRRLDEKYCSNSCKTEFHKQLLREQSEQERLQTVKACPICDKDFTPKKSLRQKYCSAYCRNLFPKKIYKALQRCRECTDQKKLDRSHKLLGYTPRDLIEHIQAHPNWDDLKDDAWHLDHIFPIIAFVEHGIKDVAIICALDNLQPLSGSKNCKKNGNYDKKAFQEYLNGS